MGWRSQNGLFLAVLLLASSSTIAQGGLEQTTPVAESEVTSTQFPEALRYEEESGTQALSDGDEAIDSESPTPEDSVIENLNRRVEEERDESEGSRVIEIESKPSALVKESGKLAPEIQEPEIIEQTTPSEVATDKIVEEEHEKLKDEASNIESQPAAVPDKDETEIKESEIAQPIVLFQSMIETVNEREQEDAKLLLQVEEELENLDLVQVPAESTVVEPGYVPPEKMDYSSWRVYKVEGFGSPQSPTLRGQSNTDESGAKSDFDVLLQLEENPKVRVLHENRLHDYFQIAISPDSDSRAGVLGSLESKGFAVQDTQVDLGQLIAEAEDGVFRSTLPQGAVTFDSYMTYEQIEDFIIEFANLHPQIVTRSEIGKSVEGRSIHMLTLTMGPGSTQKLNRRSRQASREPEKSYPTSDEALKTLERIISWSDSQVHDQKVPETGKQDQRQQRLSDSESERKSEDGSAPEFLEHMMYNMPYEVIRNNEPFSGAVSDTYSTLNKIINLTQFHDNDYALLDFSNEPPELQVTYKVLQKIINYDPKDKTRAFSRNPGNSNYLGVGSNRIAKSLDSNETTRGNETDSEASEIDKEAELLFIVTSIIPNEYADNATMIDSISDSVRIIMKNVPRGDDLTDEVIQRIAPQIVQIPGVVGVASDGSGSQSDLLSKLDKILRSKSSYRDLNSPDQSVEDEKDPAKGPATKASSNKPVIFIDGGIHAREWISPAFLLYAATQLVENTQLLLGAEWQLVPVLNPDGYVHTWKSDRMWRKNRGSGSQWCRGVDLNRNFGYKHGGQGSSNNHCSEIFRGASAFSEPESRALKRAVEAVQHRLKAYVTVHSYGQMILHPWGYAEEFHPDAEKMRAMGNGMSKAMRAVSGEVYEVGSAAATLYPAAGASDDWVSSLGVPYSYTVELRDTGSKGFILPASQILPTVKEAWEGIKYLGQRVIQETPRLNSATAPTTLSQTGLDMLSALQGVGITSEQGEPVLRPYPALISLDHDAGIRFRNGGLKVPQDPSSSSFPVAPLVPIFGLRPGNFNFDFGFGQLQPGVPPPNAHFKQGSNFGLPQGDFFSQFQHGLVSLESDPNSYRDPAELSHFAHPTFQSHGFQSQEQAIHPNANQGQIQERNKFRDSLHEHEPAVNPGFITYPFIHQNLPQYNVPYPALQPGPQFLPGLQAGSQFGGSPVPYNSPMVINPSFFDPEIQHDQMSLRHQPSNAGSHPDQISKFSLEAHREAFNPSFRISDQPFRPILHPFPPSPSQAQFKTNIHAVTAPNVPEAEPKFSHPFLESSNILVSLGSPHRPDPNAFRYEIPQNERFSILEYPRFKRRLGLLAQ